MCLASVLTDFFDLTYASCNLSCNKCELTGVKIVCGCVCVVCVCGVGV